MATIKLDKMPKDSLVRLVKELQRRADRYEKLDAEASTHVESVIVMRTRFTGEPPYVGWQGLGLALNEALDERDYLKSLLSQYEGSGVHPSTAEPRATDPVSETDDDVGC
ncbi:MAG: hypothetical protein EOP83_09395 [Verrucomicrobiaceae bacterium]|nr:MAG: hypothetical protein EOP83_09395 [Verrucomicrobiaceae bacterium]